MTDQALHRLFAAARPPCKASGRLTAFLAGLVVLGVAALVSGITGDQPLRAWQAYLVNLVFWTALAAGCVLFSAIQTLTHAHWGRSLKRLAEAPALFLVAALPLLAGLYPGRELIFPWIAHPLPAKAHWLNAPSLFLRDGTGLLLLALTAWALILPAIRRDQRLLAAGHLDPPPQEQPKSAMPLANLYGILYFLVLSLIAFDLIMSLSPEWYSTLFGAYYLVGGFYCGLALLIILAVIATRSLGLAEFITPVHFQNLGKLLLGFCLMTGDFFYTQFLVMWYGNLPEETSFIIERIRFAPWRPLSWTVLFVCFIIPFATLLSSRIKVKPWAMVALCTLILSGMWLERFLLVAPSVWPAKELPIGIMEVGITAGFFGLMALTITLFLGRFPLLPVADPLFHRHLAQQAEEGSHGH